MQSPLRWLHPYTVAMAQRRLLSVMLVFTLASATVLSACAPTESLNFICSNEEQICERWQQRFEADTAIATRYLRLPTSEALARIEAAGTTPEFDVWVGGPSENYAVAASLGLLEPYTPSGLADIPVQYRDPDHRWYGVYASILALCSNPDVLDQHGWEAPSSWRDLENPALRTWISASSPLTSGTAFTALWAQVRLFSDAENHLAQVYDNAARLTHSGTAPAEVVARGEAAVAISFAPYCHREQAGSGRSLIIRYPTEGTAYEVGAAAVLRGARHQNSAQTLVDWLTSASGQQIVAAPDIGQTPITRQLPNNLEQILQSTGFQVLSSDVAEAARQRERWLAWFSHYATENR